MFAGRNRPALFISQYFTAKIFGAKLLILDDVIMLRPAAKRPAEAGRKACTMANTDLISVSLLDDKGATTTTQIFVPSGLTLLQIEALADAAMDALDNVTGAQITAATVQFALTVPGTVKGAPLADHFNNQGVNMGFDCANTPYRFTLRVPAVRDSLVASGQLNTADPAVQTLITTLTGGIDPAFPSDRYGNDVAAFIAAALTFRK